jgi:hypothetical protein
MGYRGLLLRDPYKIDRMMGCVCGYVSYYVLFCYLFCTYPGLYEQESKIGKEDLNRDTQGFGGFRDIEGYKYERLI